jgi:hypothetical protein
MKSAKQLRKELEDNILELQKTCTHEDTDWYPYSWAPGHYCGEAKVCNFCEKIMEKRIPTLTNTVSSTDNWNDFNITATQAND